MSKNKELDDAREDALALVEHFEGSNVPGGDRAERRRLGSSLRMLLQRLSSTEASLEASQSARRRMEEELGEKLASAERSARSFSALVHELEAKLAESERIRTATGDKYAPAIDAAERQAADAHALRFTAEGHLRAVLAAGWADGATGPAAVRDARAWLLGGKVEANALFPLPKPARVETGQRWAHVFVVRKDEWEHPERMLQMAEYIYLGEDK